MTRFWHSCALDAKNAANMALQRHMVVDFPEFCGISHDPFQKWLEHLCVPYSGPHQSVLIAIAHKAIQVFAGSVVQKGVLGDGLP
jgi:hypothetical protein